MSMYTWKTSLRHTVLASGLALLTSAAFLQSALAQVGHPDISGFWELREGSRYVPEAQLADSVTEQKLAEVERHDARSVRWCNMLGTPWLMTQQDRALEIWAGSGHVTMLAQTMHAPVRYAYLDRDSHVDPMIFDPSTNGQSVARWEGDTLVVETIGFSDTKGALAIPGGGYKTADSHLLERIRLLDDNTLTIVSTWTDPSVFAQPHTYEYRYHRLPDTFAPQSMVICDSMDQERVRFLEQAWGGPGSLD